jgi:hypothetical protein
MSYRDNSNYEPLGRQRASTELEKAVAVLAIIAALLMIVGVFADSKGAPAYVKAFDWGIAPLGLVQWGIAWTYIERAGANRPEENYSQRALRLTALAFVILGAIIVAVGVSHHFGGSL